MNLVPVPSELPKTVGEYTEFGRAMAENLFRCYGRGGMCGFAFAVHSEVAPMLQGYFGTTDLDEIPADTPLPADIAAVYERYREDYLAKMPQGVILDVTMVLDDGHKCRFGVKLKGGRALVTSFHDILPGREFNQEWLFVGIREGEVSFEGVSDDELGDALYSLFEGELCLAVGFPLKGKKVSVKPYEGLEPIVGIVDDAEVVFAPE